MGCLEVEVLESGIWMTNIGGPCEKEKVSSLGSKTLSV